MENHFPRALTLAKPECDNVCRPNREAVRAATHYRTRAWQTLMHGKECYIVIFIYLPFQHKCLRCKVSKSLARAVTSITARLRRASFPFEHAPDTVLCLVYSKTGVYRGILYFLIFALKHRLWVLVRAASLRRF